MTHSTFATKYIGRFVFPGEQGKRKNIKTQPIEKYILPAKTAKKERASERVRHILYRA